MTSAFCATCTEVRSDLVRSASGHWLCPDCSPDVGSRMPAAVSTARGYDIPESHRIGAIREAFSAGAERVDPRIGTLEMHPGRGTTPGFVIQRVGRKLKGRALDRDEARETMRGQPWFAELRHVGSDARFHIFERPDTELSRRVRGEDRTDVAGGLEALSKAVRR